MKKIAKITSFSQVFCIHSALVYTGFLFDELENNKDMWMYIKPLMHCKYWYVTYSLRKIFSIMLYSGVENAYYLFEKH